jgi:hypothetical protein
VNIWEVAILQRVICPALDRMLRLHHDLHVFQKLRGGTYGGGRRCG